LFKHFFSDFGVPQKYAHLDITLETTANQIIYRTTTNTNLPKSNLTPSLALLPILDVTAMCHFINPHKVSIETLTNFYNHFDYPDFMEKMATTIISKIFLRTKQFIEKINII